MNQLQTMKPNGAADSLINDKYPIGRHGLIYKSEFSFKEDQLSEVSALLGIRLNPVDAHDGNSYFDPEGWLCGTKVAKECHFKMWKWMYDSKSKAIMAALRSELNEPNLHKVVSKKTYLHPFLAGYFLKTIPFEQHYEATITELLREVKNNIAKILNNSTQEPAAEKTAVKSSVSIESREEVTLESSRLDQIRKRLEGTNFDRGLRRGAYALDLSQGDFMNWLSSHGYVIADEVIASNKTGECEYKWKPSKEMQKAGYMVTCHLSPNRMGISQVQTLITPKGMLAFFDQFVSENVLG